MYSRNILRTVSQSNIRRLPVRRLQPLFQARFESSDLESKRQSLTEKIESNEAVKQTLNEFAELMYSKGFHPKMGIMQQMKFLMDSEVKESLKKLGQEFKEAGIEFSLEDFKTMTEAIFKKK